MRILIISRPDELLHEVADLLSGNGAVVEFKRQCCRRVRARNCNPRI